MMVYVGMGAGATARGIGPAGMPHARTTRAYRGF